MGREYSHGINREHVLVEYTSIEHTPVTRIVLACVDPCAGNGHGMATQRCRFTLGGKRSQVCRVGIAHTNTRIQKHTQLRLLRGVMCSLPRTERPGDCVLLKRSYSSDVSIEPPSEASWLISSVSELIPSDGMALTSPSGAAKRVCAAATTREKKEANTKHKANIKHWCVISHPRGAMLQKHTHVHTCAQMNSFIVTKAYTHSCQCGKLAC